MSKYEKLRWISIATGATWFVLMAFTLWSAATTHSAIATFLLISQVMISGVFFIVQSEQLSKLKKLEAGHGADWQAFETYSDNTVIGTCPTDFGTATASGAGGESAAEPTCREVAPDSSGIVVGEVEAFRHWQTAGAHLVSGMGALWVPGQPMRGSNVGLDNTNGVHAWKRYADALAYSPGGVVGKVKLWGVVIEHEMGYRAEYAKPLAIIDVRDGTTTKEAIECLYGLKSK